MQVICLLAGTVKRKMELVKADCCYILKEQDEICILRWLSGISPVNLANKKLCSSLQPQSRVPSTFRQDNVRMNDSVSTRCVALCVSRVVPSLSTKGLNFQ